MRPFAETSMEKTLVELVAEKPVFIQLPDVVVEPVVFVFLLQDSSVIVKKATIQSIFLILKYTKNYN
jgi:hypothetical protein